MWARMKTLAGTVAALALVDGFFEWKAIKGQRAKQPYAIVMKSTALRSGSEGYGRTGRAGIR
jgi:putative SOS response-associated peptidase YedK